MEECCGVAYPDTGCWWFIGALNATDPACCITGSSTEGRSCKRCPSLKEAPLGSGEQSFPQRTSRHIKSMPWGIGEFKLAENNEAPVRVCSNRGFD
jgi:hypothetical protein